MPCPCEIVVHPSKIEIPVGLRVLQRQSLAFPAYREAVLSAALRQGSVLQGGEAPLRGWVGEKTGDLVTLLVEAYAYVGDVIGFYDERIANETYLRTSARRVSLLRHVEVAGYTPFPGTAGSVLLAGFGGGGTTLLGAAVAARSDAFGEQPPQVYESERDARVSARANAWTLGPVRPGDVSGSWVEAAVPNPGDRGRAVLLKPETASAVEGGVLVFAWGEGPERRVETRRVLDVASVEGRDGFVYARVLLDGDLSDRLDAGSLDEVDVLGPSQEATLTTRRFIDTDLGGLQPKLSPVQPDGGPKRWIYLDTVYRQLTFGQVVTFDIGVDSWSTRVWIAT